MKEPNLKLSVVYENYPSYTTTEVSRLISEAVKKNPAKLIVLDDDPTGTQAVHGVFVYTNWDVETLKEALNSQGKLFFILTNSRALSESQTTKLHQEIALNLLEAAKQTHHEFIIISRSDSTLRGHFPLETEILRQTIEKRSQIKYDGEIICPFFQGGGRYTIADVHYLEDGEDLVPVAQTEFAKDPTFGYVSSNLRDYIEEKTKGAYSKETVVSISLEDIRSLNYANIEKVLLNVSDFNKVIVNAISKSDLQVVGIAIYRALKKGKQFIFRTSADFVQMMGDISEKPLLSKSEINSKATGNGGIIFVGSYTKKTTAQLNELLSLEKITGISFHSDLVDYPVQFKHEIERVVVEINRRLPLGEDIVIYTQRQQLLVANRSKEEALARSVKISVALQFFIAQLKFEPSYIVAKGGITSSDIATKALNIKKAYVLGQIASGVPVWLTGEESKFPGLAYVIFPGNVGEKETLKKVITVLSKKRKLGETSAVK